VQILSLIHKPAPVTLMCHSAGTQVWVSCWHCQNKLFKYMRSRPCLGTGEASSWLKHMTKGPTRAILHGCKGFTAPGHLQEATLEEAQEALAGEHLKTTRVLDL
jgi:hypothetical protein